MTAENKNPDMDQMLRSLAYAIDDADLATIASLIKSGVDVNAQEIPGDRTRDCPVIVLAALSGSVPACELILAAGADVNSVGLRRETALHHAADHGHLEVCRCLIAAGADVNAAAPSGDTPIVSAIRCGNVEVFKVLLDSGASVRVQNLLGLSPLHFAARHQRAEISRMLLAHGADCQISAQAHSPRGSALWYASPLGNLTPLHVAVDVGDVEICRMLVEGGADPVYMPQSGLSRDYLTPFHMAIEMRRLAIVRYFLFECDLDYEATPVIFGGKTLMQLVSGSPEIVEYLKVAKSERAVTRALEGADVSLEGAASKSGSASMRML